MGLVDLGGILVALIAALGAWAAQRSAAKATRINTSVSGRLEAEREAYERARAFDLKTIERQDSELSGLRQDNSALRVELVQVRDRVLYLETEKIPALERELHERKLQNGDNK